MNFESLIENVGKRKFDDLPEISRSFDKLGLELQSIQSGKDPLAPHGEVFRVMNNASQGAIAILKISAANSAPKMRRDLRLNHRHNIPVPETHIFPVAHNTSLIIQRIIIGKSFDSMTDDSQYHFLLETLPQLRKQVLTLMSVFCRTFPSPRKPLSRYPDPSGNRAEGYVMRKWMNLFIAPGEGNRASGEKLISALERMSPKTCLVDTGWAIHQTTQQRFTREGIKTHDYFGNYLEQILKDRGVLAQIAQGNIYLGNTFVPNEGDLGYLTPTHIATLAIPRQYAESMILDKEGHIHIFRPNNRENPTTDGLGLHYVGVIEEHGSHTKRLPPKYSHQLPVEIVERRVVPLSEVSDLFANMHPDSDLTLKGFMQEQYGCIPEQVTHTVLELLPEKINSIVT